MKKIYSIVCFFILTTQLIANDSLSFNGNTGYLKTSEFSLAAPKNYGGSSPKSVVKINLNALSFKNISLQYEYGFHEHFSAAVGVNYFLKRGFPSTVADLGTFSDDHFSAWGITPEVRFYPGSKHDAPHGFYISAYGRYSKYTIQATTPVEVEDLNTGISRDVNMSGKVSFSAFTGGLMIGSQWLIGSHFSLDWWILGGGYGKGKLSMTSDVVGKPLTKGEQADFKTRLEDDLEGLSYGLRIKSSEVGVTPTSADATVSKLSVTGIRGFGLCVGFSF
jgi:hypothetical protein